MYLGALADRMTGARDGYERILEQHGTVDHGGGGSGRGYESRTASTPRSVSRDLSLAVDVEGGGLQLFGLWWWWMYAIGRWMGSCAGGGGPGTRSGSGGEAPAGDYGRGWVPWLRLACGVWMYAIVRFMACFSRHGGFGITKFTRNCFVGQRNMKIGYGGNIIKKHMSWWMDEWAWDLVFGNKVHRLPWNPWWKWRKRRVGELNWIHEVMSPDGASMRGRKRRTVKRTRLPKDAEDSPINLGIKRPAEDMAVTRGGGDKDVYPFRFNG